MLVCLGVSVFRLNHAAAAAMVTRPALQLGREPLYSSAECACHCRGLARSSPHLFPHSPAEKVRPSTRLALLVRDGVLTILGKSAGHIQGRLTLLVGLQCTSPTASVPQLLPGEVIASSKEQAARAAARSFSMATQIPGPSSGLLPESILALRRAGSGHARSEQGEALL